MTTGERGPTGDHGQDGRQGVTGAVGARGAKGEAGKDVLSKAQSLALFAFVVIAFLALAYRSEMSDKRQDGAGDRRELFLDESCRNQPDLTPKTCALPR